jgi:hypothetical protein
MTTKGRTLPRGTPWDDRAPVLAKRLIPDLPSWLDPPTSEKQWMMLWAAIGMELAEKEPEFGWGPGRHLGSVNKEPLAYTENAQTRYKRRVRDKQRRKTLSESKGD